MSRKAENYTYNLNLIALHDCTNGACNTRKSDFWMSNPKFKTPVFELYTTDNYISGLLIHRTLNLPFFILNICFCSSGLTFLRGTNCKGKFVYLLNFGFVLTCVLAQCHLHEEERHPQQQQTEGRQRHARYVIS
jgi:hypothetical protein